MDNPKILIPGSIVLAAVIIGGAILMRGVPSSPSGQQAGIEQSSQGDNPQVVQTGVGDLPVLGDPRAPITIIEFGDFQCPFCKRFFVTTEQQIKDQYVKTGKAKFIWRDFAFLGEESVKAAEAARCANEQGKFWDYHDTLFQRQGGENAGVFKNENLVQFAQDLGLNKDEFRTCLESGKYRQRVQQDTQEGQQIGVSGTPTTIVNGKLIVGALPFQAFQQVIDAELQGSPR